MDNRRVRILNSEEKLSIFHAYMYLSRLKIENHILKSFIPISRTMINLGIT